MALGGLEMAGYWDAAENKITPGDPANRRLTDGPTPNPKVFLVVVAGATPLGGISDWNVGDWAVNYGYGWGKFAGGVTTPPAASLVAMLNSAIASGLIPNTPGGPGARRIWLNDTGDGTGFLAYS